MKKKFLHYLKFFAVLSIILCCVFIKGFSQTTSPAPPLIASFTPSSGPVGTSVTITGANFNATVSNNTVYFGAVKATVTSGTTTSLTVTLPAGATYQPISVLDNSRGLTGYSSKPFITTFINPFGTGVPANFYKPKVDFATGNQPFSVAIGDLDGDGKPDMVVANYAASTISLLRNISSSENISTATFADKVDFVTGSNPYAVVIGDVDGDGKPDVAVASGSSTNVSVFHNTATPGSLTASSLASKVDFTIGSGTLGIAIGDVDGDGKPELISSNYGANSISVLQNTSTIGSITASSFATHIDFTAGNNPAWVSIGDLDGDGKPDLAVANDNSNGISILRNTSVTGNITASSFEAKVDYSTGDGASTVVIGDLNEDGKPDLAVANVRANNVSVLQNNTTPGVINTASFGNKQDFAVGSQVADVAIGDVDGDGKPDLASANQYSHTISVLRNIHVSGDINSGSFGPRVDFPTNGQLLSVAIGDLNGDGKAEIATATYELNTVSVFQITIHDLPTVSCPSNITTDAAVGQCGANISFEATGNGSVTYSHAPGSFFPMGTTTVTVNSTASSGTASCSFTVTVKDVQKPVITCAGPIIMNNTPGLCTGEVTLTPPTVNDNCSSFGNALSFDGGYVAVPNNSSLNPFNEWTLETWVRRTRSGVQESLIEKYNQPASTYGYLLRVVSSDKAMAGFVFGSFAGYFITGTTTILPNTWYHLAATVNRSTGTMKLYVNGSLDAQITGMVGLPVLPNNASLKLGARGDDAATRLDDGGIMDEVRIWGVERTQAQILATMNSEVGPQAGLMALYHLNQGVAAANNAGVNTAIDGSGNNNTGNLIGFALSGATSNWVNGQGFVPSVTNNAPATYPVGSTTVTWTATDASGNSASCDQTVTIADNELPVITTNGDQNVNNDAGVCGAAVAASASATDNCTVGTPTGVRSDALLLTDNYPVGTTTITWNVTDVNGNAAAAVVQTVIVTDNEKPVANCKPATVTLVNGAASITAADVNDNSTDNCDVQSLSVSPNTFSCANVGANTVTLTVIDIHGNSSTCTATVTIIREVPTCSITSVPSNNTYTGGVPTNLYLGYGPQSTTLQVGAPASGAPYTYAWSPVTGLSSTSSSAPVFTPTAAGSYTFTVTVTNKYGCTITCSITICVLDIRVPGSNGKVYVCHATNSINGNYQTLELNVNAVAAHIFNPGHGDKLGRCDQTPCGISAVTTAASRTMPAGEAKPDAFKVSAYPNPTSGTFNLRVQTADASPVEVSVIDMQGRIVFRQRVVNPNTIISIGEKLASGSYLVEVVQGKNVKTQTIVKQ